VQKTRKRFLNESCFYKSMAEISVAVLRNIRKSVLAGKKTRKEIAEKYGVSVSTVSRIAKMSDKEFEEYIERKKAAKKSSKKCASRRKK